MFLTSRSVRKWNDLKRSHLSSITRVSVKTLQNMDHRDWFSTDKMSTISSDSVLFEGFSPLPFPPPFLLHPFINLFLLHWINQSSLFGFQKRRGGMCSFLHRVCWTALPLQLLLLLLLLLAFLLPLAEETHSCKLANNFARSFSLMLRYESPPPT